MIALISLFLLWLYFHVRGLSCNQEPSFAADNFGNHVQKFPTWSLSPGCKDATELTFLILK